MGLREIQYTQALGFSGRSRVASNFHRPAEPATQPEQRLSFRRQAFDTRVGMAIGKWINTAEVHHDKAYR